MHIAFYFVDGIFAISPSNMYGIAFEMEHPFPLVCMKLVYRFTCVFLALLRRWIYKQIEYTSSSTLPDLPKPTEAVTDLI